MLIALCSLIVLAAMLLVARAQRQRAESVRRVPVEAAPREVLWCYVGLVCASAPLAYLVPWLNGGKPALLGDMAGHAKVAAVLAGQSVTHGWLDAYAGGFPFGHHYPPLAWLISAAGVTCGVPAAAAVYCLGWLATIVTPLVLFGGLLRCGVLPRFALVAGVILSWVSPYNAFVGGYEVFFTQGLLSQVVALPICLWMTAVVVKPRRHAEGPWWVALAMAAHPQVCAVTLAVLGVGAVASGSKPLLRSFGRAVVCGAIAGAVLYGYGIATLEIPLGWPPALGWRHLGFEVSRLAWWLLDSSLLDEGRVGVITALVVSSCLVLGSLVRRPEARALLAALCASLALAVSGRAFVYLGDVGHLLLSFLQPLRAMSLVPPLAASVVALALHQGGLLLVAAVPAWRGTGRVLWSVSAITLLFLTFGLPSRIAYVQGVAAVVQSGEFSCAQYEATPEGYERGTIAGWLRALHDGALWFDRYQQTELHRCLSRDALSVDSSVAVASTDGVGSHVGVLTHAANQLRPERPGSARRAEALGIKYLLRLADSSELRGWSLSHQKGRVQLWAQDSSRVGVGCIRRKLFGGKRLLRAYLHQQLATPSGADRLLDPLSLTQIEATSGPARVHNVEAAGCRAESANVSLLKDASGLLEARVEARGETDVVFRVTAFPSWRVWVDGELRETTLVAPGFLSVRVAAGQHHVLAKVGGMSSYFLGLLAGALALSVVARFRFPL